MTSIAMHAHVSQPDFAQERRTQTRRALSSPTSRLRITSRGRVVLALVVLAPIVAAAIALSSTPASASGSGDTGALGVAADSTYVTVAAGESLWSVAERIAPDADPREVITDLELLNGLDDSAVAAGQTLAIPAQYAD